MFLHSFSFNRNHVVDKFYFRSIQFRKYSKYFLNQKVKTIAYQEYIIKRVSLIFYSTEPILQFIKSMTKALFLPQAR